MNIPNASAQENFTITNYFTDRCRDFPMMKISIIPPDGFTKDTIEAGFINAKYASAIRAEEMRLGVAAAWSTISRSFDSIEHKDSLGMKLLDSYYFTINNFKAHLLNVAGKVDGEEYIEWWILIGDPSDSYIIKGYIPLHKKKALEQQVRSSLLSVFYEPDRRLIPLGADATTTSSSACSCHNKK